MTEHATSSTSRQERIEYLSTDHPYDYRECIHCGEHVHKDYRFEGQAWDWYFNEKGMGACFGRDNDYNGNHEVKP